MSQEVCRGETTKVLSRVQTRSGGIGQRSGCDQEQDRAGIGINVNKLGRWSENCKPHAMGHFKARGKPRDERMDRLKRELA